MRLIVALVLLPGSVLAQAVRDEPRTLSAIEQPFIGCYEVETGPWRQSTDPKPHKPHQFNTIPDRIRLDTVRAVPGDRNLSRVVLPLPPAKRSIHRITSWGVKSVPPLAPGRAPQWPDTLQLSFSTGFSGVRYRLAIAGPSLVGTAREFWDFIANPAEAPAQLVRIACQAD